MARRKRASMREGPLADLFRSTTSQDKPEDPPEEPRFGREDPAKRAEAGDGSETEREAAGPVAQSPPPAHPAVSDSAHHPRTEQASDTGGSGAEGGSADARAEVREAPGESRGRERLRKIFGEDPQQSHPRYGREEPSYEPKGGEPHTPVIRVVGVGGAGVNAVNRMVEARVPGVEFMAVNTDLQSLQLCVADVTVHIGGEQTRGLGTGADPELGHRSAFDEQDKLKRLLKGSDMVFIAVGAGGGTGTGAAPVIARVARDVGALTVGIATRPFSFEGTRRGNAAREGIEQLAAEVDTLIVVPNDRLLEVLDQQTSMIEAFQVADDVLRQGVQGISDLVTLPAVINLDFADVRSIMSEAGRALLGIGMATGEGRAVLAAEKAISSPLLETSMDGARSILLSVTGGPDLSLIEVSEAAEAVGEAAHPDANIIFGANIDDELEDQIWVTVVATRFDGRPASPRRSAEPTIRRTKDAGRSGGRRDDLGIDVPEFLPG